ncbi:MAG TPA: hypothetical protein PKM65_12705 [Spirochaetota bacterium]|nr:hypothetical protein [Spirochaetota bacterium]HNT10923.1 hypothetical protein [Spirochaetota bacterium]
MPVRGRLFQSTVLVCVFATFLACGACKERNQRESEPNDTFANANPITTHMTVEGALERTNDRDHFLLTVTEPLVLDISLSGVKGVNHAFQVWRRTGESYTLLKHVDDQRKSSPERLCNLYVLPGTYCIVVLHGDKDAPQTNRETPYRLKVASRSIKDYEEQEPNDSPETANPIPMPGEIFGFFSPAINKHNTNKEHPRREEDWFSFEVSLNDNKPILVDIELSGVPAVNSTLQIFSGDMEELGRADVGEVGKGESIRGVGITTSGRYYLMVAARNVEANNDIPYSVKITKREYNYSLEMEPNNTLERANLIAENQVSGMIFPRGDIDWYRVQGGDELQVYRVEAVPPPDVDVQLRLYNDRRERLWETDQAKRGERAIMPGIVLRGEFFIEVYSKTGAVNQDKPYLLTLVTKTYADGWEKEPNDTKAAATKVTGKTVLGFTSKRKDVDYFLFEYNRRVRCRYVIRAAQGSELQVSATDPMGYILKTVAAVGGKSVRLDEMVDNRGYLVVQTSIENLDEPYVIEVETE